MVRRAWVAPTASNPSATVPADPRRNFLRDVVFSDWGWTVGTPARVAILVRSVSVPRPSMVPTIVGIRSRKFVAERLSTEAPNTTDSPITKLNPSARLRAVASPTVAAKRAAVIDKVMNRKSLSLVPNKPMARSLSHGGVKSMIVDPRATRGDEAVPKNVDAA